MFSECTHKLFKGNSSYLIRTYWKYHLVQTDLPKHYKLQKKSIFKLFVDFINGNKAVKMIDSLKPPTNVRGMTTLDRSCFDCTVKVPTFKIPVTSIRPLGKYLRSMQLAMPAIKPVADLADGDEHYKTHKLFLLDPTRCCN